MKKNPYEEAAAVLVRESGVKVGKVRSSSTGRAHDDDDWTIDAPAARGPVSFGVFAHEVAHQLLHRHGTLRRFEEEVEAEEWALDQFRRFHLAGRDRYEANVVRHLAHTFGKAIRRSPVLAVEIAHRYPAWWELTKDTIRFPEMP